MHYRSGPRVLRGSLTRGWNALTRSQAEIPLLVAVEAVRCKICLSSGLVLSGFSGCLSQLLRAA